jgi:class 3 adenylate cyclase/tetratricopeptide (TPR) repeat protein
MPQEGDIQEPIAVEEGAEASVTSEVSLLAPEDGQLEVKSASPNGEISDSALDWVDIPPAELEQLHRSRGFLAFLHSFDQGYIDECLDQEHEIKVPNATILWMDWVDFSALMEEAYKLAEADESADGPSLAARKVALLMDDLRCRLSEIIRSYGGKMDNFLGDGVNVLFEGDRAVQRAVTAANEVRDMVHQVRELSVSGLTAKMDIRMGISTGEVWITSYGNVAEKRAYLNGRAVEEAERAQRVGKLHQGDGVDIALSDSVAKELVGAECAFLKDGIYSLGELNQDNVVMPGEFSAHDNLPTDPLEIQRAVLTRERYLSRTRRGELERQYVRGKEPRQDRIAISTVFVKIPELEDRSIPYEHRNALVERVFEIAEQGRGKVDKITGDTIMINFLAGFNDENSLEASLKIHNALVNRGATDVKIACSRSEAFDLAFGAAHTVYGQGVVAARRMLDVDNPGGGVVVDEHTKRYLGRIRLIDEELPARELKGFIGLIKRYLIKDMESAHLRLERDHELIAREAELAEMRELYQRGSALLMVEGEDGIGKTALITKFMQQMAEQGAYVAMGEAEAYTQDHAYAVLRDVCDHIFSLQETDDMSKRRQYVEDFFRNPPNRMSGEVEKLVILNEIIGTDFPETDKTKYMDPEDRKAEQVRLMLRLFSSLRHIDRPAVIALENVQHWDDRTIELMRQLLPRLNKAKVMFLAAGFSIDHDGRDLSAAGLGLVSANTVEMPLRPLDVCEYDYDAVKAALAEAEQAKDAAMIELYQRQLDELNQWWREHRETWYRVINSIIPIDRTDFDSNEPGWKRIILNIAGKTRGNFRYIERVIYGLVIYRGKDRYLEEKQRPVIDENDEQMLDGNGKPMFTTSYILGRHRIQDKFFANIKEMEKLQKEDINWMGDEHASIFADASLIGRYFNIRALAYLNKLSIGALSESLKIQQRHGLVRSHGQGNYEILRGRDAAYNSIGDVRLRQLKHRRMAYYFEREEPNNLPLLVRHFRHSDDYLKALHYLDRYAERLKDHVLWKDALNQIDYATEIFNKVRERGWEILDTSTEYPVARQLTEQEIDELVDTQVARMFEAIKMWRLIGDRHKSSKLALDAQALFAAAHPSFEAMAIHDQITWARLYREIGADKSHATTFDEALLSFQTGESLLEEVGCRLDTESINGERVKYREALADLYNSWGWLYRRTDRYQDALESFQKGLSFSDSTDQQIKLLNGVASAYMNLGNLEEADVVYGEALGKAESLGQKGEIVSLLNNIANLYVRMGKLDDAERLFNKSMDLAHIISKTSGIQYADGSLGIIQRIRGDYKSALTRFEKASTYYDSRGSVSIADNIKADIVFCSIMLGGDFLDRAEALLPILHNSRTGRALAQSFAYEAMLRLKRRGVVDEETVQQFNRGIEMLRDSGILDDVAFDLLYFGRLEISIGRVNEGLAKVNEAKRIFLVAKDFSELPTIQRIQSQSRGVVAR